MSAGDEGAIPDDPIAWRIQSRVSDIDREIDKENASLSNLNEEIRCLENKRRWVNEALAAKTVERGLLQAWLNTSTQ